MKPLSAAVGQKCYRGLGLVVRGPLFRLFKLRLFLPLMLLIPRAAWGCSKMRKKLKILTHSFSYMVLIDGVSTSVHWQEEG
jgi:hypothetical protein